MLASERTGRGLSCHGDSGHLEDTVRAAIEVEARISQLI